MTTLRNLFLGVATLVLLSVAISAERTVTSTESGDIVASDLAEMQEYAELQKAHLLNRLEVANSLSDQQKELVATALSKDLEGLPLCSFSQVIVYREETEKSETRLATVHENGLITDDKSRERMFSEWKYSPFSAPPSAGMDFASGTLIEETDSEATFQFKFDKKAKSSSENIKELLGNLKRVAKNLRYDLTIDKLSGAPKKLVLELIKPTRVMVVARVKKIRHEYVYKFDEKMQRFTIPVQVVEFAYSAPTRGKVDEKIDVTYSNFECSTPIRYMWRTSTDLTGATSFDYNPQ
ncbi:MAG: hypothetical protein OXH31_08400 [Gammaproteobacteria bacterium]|nr:hypothetical protein [Gammaproteobacteria bacterium]